MSWYHFKICACIRKHNLNLSEMFSVVVLLTAEKYSNRNKNRTLDEELFDCVSLIPQKLCALNSNDLAVPQ